MITIKSDQEKQLSFDLEISGSHNEPEVRLVMETKNKGLKLMFPGQMENGTAYITIPKLSPILDIFDNREVSLKLETILEGTHSVIWEDTNVKIQETVKVSTKKPIIEDLDDKQTIKVTSVEEIEDTPSKKLDEKSEKPDKKYKKTSIKEIFKIASK